MSTPAAPATRDASETAAAAGDGWWQQTLVELGGVSFTPAGLAGALGVFVVAWLVSWAVRRGLARFSKREGTRDRHAAIYTVGRIVHYLLLFVAFLVALELIGLPASRFAVFAGAIGVGLGFGLQAIFNNFISGLILLFDRSLKVGDFVELESGVHGEVSDINIRATRITTNDNIEILVPNSEFVSGRVVNWTHNDVSRRMRIPFGVAVVLVDRGEVVPDADQVGMRGRPHLGQQPRVGPRRGGFDVAAGFGFLDHAHGVVAVAAPGFDRRAGEQAAVDRAGHGGGGSENEGDQGVGTGVGRDAQARGRGGIHCWRGL